MSVRTVSKWLARYRARGRGGSARSFARRRARIPQSDAGGAGRGDRGAAPVADDGGGDRRGAGDAALDGLGGADPDRAGQALAAGAARAGQPLRAQPARRAAPHRRQEARPDRPARPPRQRRPPHPQHAGSAGSTSTSASTTRPGSPTSRCSTTRRPSPRVGFLRRAVAHYRAHGIRVERVMTDNGSGYRATIHALACQTLGSGTSAPGPTGRAPTAKPNASSAPCSAAGPTARSTPADRTPRRPPRLARLLQSPTTTRQPQPPTAHEPHPRLMNNVLLGPTSSPAEVDTPPRAPPPHVGATEDIGMWSGSLARGRTYIL